MLSKIPPSLGHVLTLLLQCCCMWMCMCVQWMMASSSGGPSTSKSVPSNSRSVPSHVHSASRSVPSSSRNGTSIQLSDAAKSHCLFPLLDFIAKSCYKQSEVLQEVKGKINQLQQAQKELTELIESIHQTQSLCIDKYKVCEGCIVGDVRVMAGRHITADLACRAICRYYYW